MFWNSFHEHDRSNWIYVNIHGGEKDPLLFLKYFHKIDNALPNMLLLYCLWNQFKGIRRHLQYWNTWLFNMSFTPSFFVIYDWKDCVQKILQSACLFKLHQTNMFNVSDPRDSIFSSDFFFFIYDIVRLMHYEIQPFCIITPFWPMSSNKVDLHCWTLSNIFVDIP